MGSSGEPGWQDTNIEAGTAHPPVKHVPEIHIGGPASQYTEIEKMPEAFKAPCVESAPSGLRPRATAAKPGVIEPGREAPRLFKKGDGRTV
jgi:hypothetical protein